MSGGKATVLCYWIDSISNVAEEIDYSKGSSQFIKVHTRISFNELVDKIYTMTKWDRVSTNLKIIGRLCTHSNSLIHLDGKPITDDKTLSTLLDTFEDENIHRIELYLRCLRTRRKTNEKSVVADPSNLSSKASRQLPPYEIGSNPGRERLNRNVSTESYMRPIRNINPGPRDRSILKFQKDHRSSDIWENIIKDPEVDECYVRVRCGRVWIPHQNLHRYIMEAGFIGIMHVPYLHIDHGLMTALVERWRQETHTFHFPVGEMTITLEDVAMLLGLPIDGDPVTGGPPFFVDSGTGSLTGKWADYCKKELGLRPGEEDITGSSLQLKWLSDNFSELPEADNYDAELYDIILQRYTKAWLLAVLGTVLCPSTSGDIVSLSYLVQLSDLEKVINYSWGSAVLANLYRGLCRATKRGAKEMSGCAMLLQLWSFERLHIGRPRMGRWHSLVERENGNNGGGNVANDNGENEVPNVVLHPDIADNPFARAPYGRRWIGPKCFRHTGRSVVLFRTELDAQNANEVKWQPYEHVNENEVSPLCFAGRNIWRAKVPLICYHVVEWHFPDRVLRQFGLFQGIPKSCDTDIKLHGVNKRGQRKINWAEKHSSYVGLWERRLEFVIHGHRIEGEPRYWDAYLQWYREITRLFIARPVAPNEMSEPTLEYHGKTPLWDKLVDTLVEIVKKCESNVRSRDQRAPIMQGYTSIRSICLSALSDAGELKRLEIISRPVNQRTRVTERGNTSSAPSRQARLSVRVEPSNGPSLPPQKPQQTQMRGAELSSTPRRARGNEIIEPPPPRNPQETQMRERVEVSRRPSSLPGSTKGNRTISPKPVQRNRAGASQENRTRPSRPTHGNKGSTSQATQGPTNTELVRRREDSGEQQGDGRPALKRLRRGG